MKKTNRNRFLFLCFFSWHLTIAQTTDLNCIDLTTSDFEISKGDSIILTLCLENKSEMDTILIDKAIFRYYTTLKSANHKIWNHVSVDPVRQSDAKNMNCYYSDYLQNDNYLVIMPNEKIETVVNFSFGHEIKYDKIRRVKGCKTKYLFFITINIPDSFGSYCDKILTGSYTTKNYYFYTILD